MSNDTNNSTIESLQDILDRVQVPSSVLMDCSEFQKGIDNYHVDVHLSDIFVLQAHSIVEAVVKRVAAGGRAFPGNTEELENFRESYSEMIRTTFHRAKTDLSPESIRFLHFGVIKFVLLETRLELDKLQLQIEESIAQQQYGGSRNLLPTQEKLAWFRKNYNEFMYRSNRAVFQQLQREENGRLRELRRQLLGPEFPELVNILFNPMLCAATPADINLQIENYGLWPKGGLAFSDANNDLEDILSAQLPELQAAPLKHKEKLASAQSEVFDELSGLFAVQSILGPSDDQSQGVTETFSCLEQPGNIRLLFDTSVHETHLERIKESKGRLAHRSLSSDVKKMQKLLETIRKKITPDPIFKEALAAYLLREVWVVADKDILTPAIACSYIAGNDVKKITAKLEMEKESTLALLKRLDEVSSEVNRQFKEEIDEKFLRWLTDLCRYRLHLKYYRFAHRILNRINLILEPDELRLARSGGKLYELLALDEHQAHEEVESEIVRHVIVKADIRGSTSVIAELQKKGLNPASYFSERFFDPLTRLLDTYGAVKVFIEGDAVILSIYEMNDEPHHWYAVSRACGIAKDIIDIVNSKNAHSKQTGLPKLEIGIGISFSNEKPLFLFDEAKPIMISSAIGDAHRLSSCSWSLREAFKNSRFNVEVLTLADKADSDKGQDKLRYNVNGMLLDDASFSKLKTEVVFQKLSIKVADGPGSEAVKQTMYVSKFPDLAGKERDLVIRAGKVALWKDQNRVLPNESETCEYFYEVLPHSKLTGQVVEAAKKMSKKS